MATCRLLLSAVGTALLIAGAGQAHSFAGERMAAVAVFPVENLSGSAAPVDRVRRLLVERLTAGGVRVLDDDTQARFLTRHRVRYAAGIDSPTAALLRQETGAEGVVVASLGLSNDVVPPKFALTVRLVSTAPSPLVVWASDAGLSGDDAPGWFQLGLVDDYDVLVERALDRVTSSLVTYVTTGQTASGVRPADKFRPKSAYRSRSIEPGRTYTVGVVPFVNMSGRRNAGEIVSLLFVRHLAMEAPFRVVDTGDVRRHLLGARIIMDGGLSVTDAETLAALSEADLVLGGRVMRYEDYEGPTGLARVEFSATLIERKSRRVVWSSESDNEGGDGVTFFERGTTRTAHAMATQMVRLVVEMIAGHRR